MTLKGDYIVEAILLRPTREEPDPSPTPEEDAALLDKEEEPPEVPGPSPRHLGIHRFVEPTEQTTASITPAPSCLASKPCSCPSQKGKKLGEGIDVDPSNPGQSVQVYMERDSRIPERLKKFYSLVCSMDRHHDDTKVKILVCQQAAAFHLPATQKKVHGNWTAPPCLAVLGKRECHLPRDPRITQDYKEVWKEETAALAIVIQRHAIHARASPDTFCRAVQEL